MSLDVADSTITDSPRPDSTTFKRAAVTYGRKRHAIEEEDLTSASVARDWDGVQTRSLRTVNDEASPCSSLSRLPPDKGRVNEDVAKERHDEAAEFVFAWKKKLAEWSDQEEADSSTSNANQQLFPELSPLTPVDASEMGCAATKYGLDSDVSQEQLFATDDGHGGVFRMETVISPGAGIGPSRRHASRRGAVHDSGSESELSNAKLGSSIHKSSPFAFQTPNSRSSPTPPTSDDEISWSTSKGKEKANIVPRKSVSSLHFDEESTESESLERTSNVRPKRMKAPTKKERMETAKNSVRLAADQRVSISKAEGNCKYTVQNLLAYLNDSQTREVKQPSDPIVSFSSSPPGPHVGLTTSRPVVVSRQDAEMPQTPVADDGSFNTTDVPAIQQGSVRENKLKELQMRKQRLLALQMVRTETDDEDDLEIIADDENFSLYVVNRGQLTGKGKQRTSFKVSKPERLGVGSAAHLQVEHRSHKPGNAENIVSTQVGSSRMLAQQVTEHNKRLITQKGSATFLRVEHRSNKAGNVEKATLTQIELSRQLAQQVAEHNKRLTAQKDEEWIKRGGQLRGLPKEGSQDTLKTYVKKGLVTHSKGQLELDVHLMGEVNDGSDSSNSDDESGIAHSPVPTDIQPEQEEAEVPKFKMRRHRKVAILDTDSEIEKDEAGLPSKDTVFKFGRSNLGVDRMPSTDENDENSMPPPSPSLFGTHRDSVSSLDDQAEDRSDKENNRILMFDRGEDKENKATVRHSSPKGLPNARDDANLSTGLDVNGGELQEENILKDDTRSPLTVLSEDQSSRSQSDPSWGDMLTPHRSTSPMAQGDVSSEGSKTKFNATLLPEASFSALFESGTEDPKRLRISTDTASEGPLGSLDLTQDLILQPAFNINNRALLRKAESIFEKEQAYLLEAGGKGPQKKQLYVNDFGFLTQTRPHDESPEPYETPYPSRRKDAGEVPTGSPTKDLQRYPLSTLSLLTPEDSDEPINVSRRRLVKRRAPSPSQSLPRTDLDSPTPAPRLVMNVPDILSQGSKGPAQLEKQRNRLEKSEFVQSEAEESDDDDVFTFLPKKRKDEEEEEDNNDLDRTLETLVDDRHMDEETLNAPRVLEKFKEDMELKDQEMEKLHQAAVQGELRRKRRNRGVGLDDSDEESDEDERARKIRRKMNKSQRIDRDNIKALAENQETRAFYQAYEHGVLDDDGVEVQRDVVMGEAGNDDEQGTQDTQDYVTRDEIQGRARELARRKEIEPTLDPHDVSWIDKEVADDDVDMNVRVANTARRKNVAIRRDGLDKDFDDAPEISKPSATLEDDREKSRMRSWARMESKSRNTTTVRSGSGVAVTGHAKSKPRSQSKTQQAEASKSTAEQHNRRKPLKAMPSMLADVSDRSARFR